MVAAAFQWYTQIKTAISSLGLLQEERENKVFLSFSSYKETLG